MTDFYEIDFLDVETKRSGDAIALRYRINGVQLVHVVDGGYMSNGESLVNHVRKFYQTDTVHHVVATHPDGDHTAGLRTVLTDLDVRTLWMNRPWLYADELMARFSRYTNRDNLIRDLKRAFPNTAALEEIAEYKGIPIYPAFQGATIGAFTVMAPTRARYIEKVLDSEKTGVVAKSTGYAEAVSAGGFLKDAFANLVSLVRSSWGHETFPAEGTSPENEMSVVQYAQIAGHKILLTADTGREGLAETVSFAPMAGLFLPGIDKFQVPHHGSRRNVSTDLLDQILGPRLQQHTPEGEHRFTAVISSAKEDPDHPRKAVVRSMIHRGGKVISTEGTDIVIRQNAPDREGYGPIQGMPYPTEQED